MVYLVCRVAQYLDWTNATAPIAETQIVKAPNVMAPNGKAQNVMAQNEKAQI